VFVIALAFALLFRWRYGVKTEAYAV